MRENGVEVLINPRSPCAQVCMVWCVCVRERESVSEREREREGEGEREAEALTNPRSPCAQVQRPARLRLLHGRARAGSVHRVEVCLCLCVRERVCVSRSSGTHKPSQPMRAGVCVCVFV